MRAHLLIKDTEGATVYDGNVSDVEISDFQLRYRQMAGEDKRMWPEAQLHLQHIASLTFTPCVRDEAGRQIRHQES